MRIAERHHGLVEEHEFEDDRRTVAQHRVGPPHRFEIERIAHVTGIVVLRRDPFVERRDGRIEHRMEHEDPLPVAHGDQTLDLAGQQRRRSQPARKGRRIENHGPLVPRQPLHVGRKVEIGLRPSGFVGPEMAVLAFQSAEGRRAAGPLRTDDVEPAPDREVVVDRLEALAVGISVADPHLHARKEIGDVARRREDGDGVVRQHFIDRAQTPLAGFEQIGTPLLQKPCGLAAATPDLLLQRSQDGKCVGQRGEQKVFFRFHTNDIQRWT